MGGVSDAFLVLGLAKRRPNVDTLMLTPPRPRESMHASKQRSPKVQDKENAPDPQRSAPRKRPSARGLACRPSPLGDRTVQMRNSENSRASAPIRSTGETDRSVGSVRNRMREWELERERLREMERVGESDTQDTEHEAERPVPVRKPSQLRDQVSEAPPSPSAPFPFGVRARCVVTAIPIDARSTPSRSNDLFARTMSARLFKPVKESSVTPTSMLPLPGTANELLLLSL